ncbi:MAG: tRNA pseudouridine(13) synthase TruD [Acidilobus sp.]
MPLRSPHWLDRHVGMLVYYLDEGWPPLGAIIRRPEGFTVIEEVSGAPCTEFRPSGRGNMRVYLLAKVGVDHATAVRLASRALGSRPHHLGMKDSNAVTYQLVYTLGGRPRPGRTRLSGVELTYLGDHDSRLEHTGNRFIIRVEGDQAELKGRVERLASAPLLPAFFGYQRFGLVRPNSHLVGKAIVRGDLREALDLLLGRPFEAEPESWRAFRRLYDDGRPEEALRAAPRSLWPEARVLRELLRSSDPARAIKAYPMGPGFFIEAYQSYIFNLCLSGLIEANGALPRALRVPRRASDAEGACREVMRDEGVEELASGQLGAAARDLTRPSLMEVRGLRLGEAGLEFSLPRGMYATVVLRELLRQDPFTFAG